MIHWEVRLEGAVWPNLEILVLGPLMLRRDGREVPAGGHHARIVLSALVVGVNHAVSADQLAWAVWGDEQPDSVTNTVQTYVSRIRHLLGPDSIETFDHSYALNAKCEQVDSCRFEGMIHEAGHQLEANPEAARKLSRDALGLWRGMPFGEFADREFAQLEAIRLGELRMLAIEIETESGLQTGHKAEAVAQLQALTHEHPMRERFWHLLIRGLVAQKRRPEAVFAYESYAAALDGMGLQPDVSLEELLLT